MRTRLLFALGSIASAIGLVHCVDGAEPGFAPPPSPDAAVVGPSNDGATVTPDASDAAVAIDASDGGARCSADHWCRTPLPTADFDLQAVWSFAPDDAFAVGSSGAIHWDGKTWSVVSDGTDAGIERITSLWASGPNDLWGVAAGDGHLFHGVRGATGALAWSSYDMNAGASFQFVSGRAPGDLWITAFADDGTQLLEHATLGDAGPPTLTPVTVGVQDFSMGRLFVAASGDLFVAGSVQNANAYAAVARGRKNGNAYKWETSLSTEGQPFDTLQSIYGVPSGELWSLGARAVNYHYGPASDGGLAWSTAPNNANTALAALWGAAATDFWAVGYFGAIRHWDGKAWSLSQTSVNGAPIFSHLADVHGSSANDVWAVGSGVALHRSIGGSP